MDKKIPAIIGLIGGILATVGFFSTWVTTLTGLIEPGWGSASGWGLTQETFGFSLKLPYFTLVGAILAVVGSVLALVKPSAVAKVLLAIGGILALIGVAYGLHMVDVGVAWETPLPEGVFIGANYGTYMVVIGGILAILATLGLREEEVKHPWR